MTQALDGELVKELQAGDLEALGVLYDRHRHLVFRTALAITGDPEMAADLLQEVFLRLYRFSHRADPHRPLEPWLYRMTANLSYTWLKRQSRWVQLFRELADHWTSNQRTAPHRIAEWDESWRWVRQAIQGLPLQQRLVVVLYYINDLSIQEIADILEIPSGTVKSRLHYARKVLRKQLGAHEEAILRVLYEAG
ncbi:MAG TPA: RNA polymerase sigma factor [Chloroflexi bacterium]|nr:RNA polymerase sigma factor [Chloroflexota bacterium]